MERAQEATLHRRPQPTKTQEATFTVTPRDVGSEAVRAGHMAELEERHAVLLSAAKLVLAQIEQGKPLSAVHEYALRAAVTVAR